MNIMNKLYINEYLYMYTKVCHISRLYWVILTKVCRLYLSLSVSLSHYISLLMVLPLRMWIGKSLPLTMTSYALSGVGGTGPVFILGVVGSSYFGCQHPLKALVDFTIPGFMICIAGYLYSRIKNRGNPVIYSRLCSEMRVYVRLTYSK
jgi:hypothetical protein